MPKAKVDYYLYQDTNDREIIAYCNKSTFLKLAKENVKDNASVNWIRERITRTGNETHLKLMKAHEGMMIVVEKGLPIELIPLPNPNKFKIEKLTFGQLKVGTKFRYAEFNTQLMKTEYYHCEHRIINAVDLNDGMLCQFDDIDIVEIEK